MLQALAGHTVWGGPNGTGHDQTVTYSPDRTFEGRLHTKTCPMPKEYNSAEAAGGDSTRQ